jgi:hypothetical protein
MADLVVGRFGLHLPSWEGVPQFGVNLPFAYLEGFVARWQRDSAKAQAAFRAARSEVAKIVEKEPDFPAALSVLGAIDSGLGRKEEAPREGRRACELLPIGPELLPRVKTVSQKPALVLLVDRKRNYQLFCFQLNS